jgi:hypothetical protein
MARFTFEVIWCLTASTWVTYGRRLDTAILAAQILRYRQRKARWGSVQPYDIYSESRWSFIRAGLHKRFCRALAAAATLRESAVRGKVRSIGYWGKGHHRGTLELMWVIENYRIRAQRWPCDNVNDLFPRPTDVSGDAGESERLREVRKSEEDAAKKEWAVRFASAKSLMKEVASSIGELQISVMQLTDKVSHLESLHHSLRRKT